MTVQDAVEQALRQVADEIEFVRASSYVHEISLVAPPLVLNALGALGWSFRDPKAALALVQRVISEQSTAITFGDNVALYRHAVTKAAARKIITELTELAR